MQKSRETRLSDSQNFITSSRLIHRIIGLAKIGAGDTVLEIGTGKGHLTKVLCEKASRVYSIEIDKRFYEGAREKLSGCSNLELFHGDFLKYRFPITGAYKVFSNIPYAITTQIIEKLTRMSYPPTELWLVMEKGVAKRFAGTPRESERSLLLKVNWQVKIVYHFRREDFHPAPSVDSVLVHFSRKKMPDLNAEECRAFGRFIRHSLKYGLCGGQGLLTRRQVAVALKQAGLPLIQENGATLYIQWLCLFRYYLQLGNRQR